MSVNVQIAEEAYILVLDNAGAILPKRDAIDARVVEDMRNGDATYEGKSYKVSRKLALDSKITGIIDTQKDIGGWPVLKSAPALKDTVHDGIPDAWEKKNGLNPKDASDRNKVAADGYTMLEKYLNSI